MADNNFIIIREDEAYTRYLTADGDWSVATSEALIMDWPQAQAKVANLPAKLHGIAALVEYPTS